MHRLVYPGIILLLLLPLVSLHVHAQNNDPAILFSTLLSQTTMAYEKGELKINYLTCAHFPDTESKTGFQYNPTDGGKFKTVFKIEGFDEPFASMTWYGKKEIDPLWTFSKYDVDKSTQPNSKDGWMNFKTQGNFTMEFYLGDKLIYKFPFSVSKLPGIPDKDPVDKWFVDGPWDRYGYFFYLGGRPQMNLTFVTWLRNKERRPRKTASVMGVVIKDGAPVAKTGDAPTPVTLTPDWQRFEFTIGSSTRDDQGHLSFHPIKAGNFLNAPGNYQLLLTIDNQLYGTYSFTVENGTFRLLPRQQPDYKPEDERMYGGNDTVWLERK